jgi:hypothetical protein
VSQCAAYEDLREGFRKKVDDLLAGRAAPLLRAALSSFDPELFLGDRLLGELKQAEAVRRSVDSAICDFLKLAWRRRADAWKLQCVEDSEWQLK